MRERENPGGKHMYLPNTIVNILQLNPNKQKHSTYKHACHAETVLSQNGNGCDLYGQSH